MPSLLSQNYIFCEQDIYSKPKSRCSFGMLPPTFKFNARSLNKSSVRPLHRNLMQKRMLNTIEGHKSFAHYIPTIRSVSFGLDSLSCKGSLLGNTKDDSIKINQDFRSQTLDQKLIWEGMHWLDLLTTRCLSSVNVSSPSCLIKSVYSGYSRSIGSKEKSLIKWKSG